MSKASGDTGRMARSAGTVSIAVMCSRVLGLVREQVFAGLFGAGFAYDAFVVAFRIPNLLRDLFGEGALSAAFVTVFTDYDTNRGREETWRLANNVLAVVAIVLSVITLLGILFSRQLVSLLAPDFSLVAGKVTLTARLTAIMFPFLLFISLAAVVMGILNAKGRFFVPALASSFFNLGSIIGGVGLALVLPRFGQPAIVGMAIGTLIGGMLQLGWQVPTLLRTGFSLRPRIDLADPGLRRVLRLMGPAVVGLSATQLNIFVNTYFASSCQEGSVSWLNYAFRLVQFPIGVFGVALSIAAAPVFSRHAARRDTEAMRRSLASSLVMVACLTVPASVGLIMLARPIVALIFEHGAFSAFDTGRTAEALVCYSIGLAAYAGVKVLVPAFYALDDTRYPVLASFLAVAANIAIILATIGSLQHRAIALATSCSMTGSFFLLAVVLHRKMGGYDLRHLAGGVLRVLAATLVMAGWLYALLGWYTMPAGIAGRALFVLVAVVSGALVYGVVLDRLAVEEFRVVMDNVRSRLR